MKLKKEVSFSHSAVIKITDSIAQVKTDCGLEYKAAGFLSVDSDSFLIDKGFSVTLDSGFLAKSFNRYTLSYVSDSALRGRIVFLQDGKEVTDLFFLEAGANIFNCLIPDYLDEKYGNDIASLSFESITGKAAHFILCDLSCRKHRVYSRDTYFIENDRFKVGVRLVWGGGICYISDNLNPVDGLQNLVNQADEGRLIQQSYYGTGENEEYSPGYFNNHRWRYNPVQGGDKCANHSRIIDIIDGDGGVYVKAQPQDWSLDGAITPSYMENTYTLTSDFIFVENRFVDFSGWQHPPAHQELPAFYTVSYLDNFRHYDGDKPWTNDSVTEHPDLDFWGDPRYNKYCNFPLKPGNTETWCCWTNDADNYGIGLFVPGIDLLLAGKHAYNKSKDPYDTACNYVAPIKGLRLETFKPLEYSYMITTGSVEEIKKIFYNNKDFIVNDKF